MLRQALTKLSEQTSIAIVLRKIVELDFRKQKATIRKFLALTPNERVLDVGCGTGEFAPFFSKEQYIGIDIDPLNIAYAKRHYHHRFEQGDATKLSFPDASFDAVLVVGVLHHLSLEDCGKALREMYRVLKPGSRAFIMEDTKSTRWITRFMHSLDQGAFIRSEHEWQTVLGKQFIVGKHWTFKSGVCFYSAFLLHRE